MALETLGTAKTIVAATFGKEHDADELTRAGRAVIAAIREWNSAEHDWSFRLDSTTKTGASAIPILTDGTHTYDVTTDGTGRKVHSAHFNTQNITLTWIDHRNFIRNIADKDQKELPTAYTDWLEWDAAANRYELKLRIFPPSSVADTLNVLYYTNIPEPAVDADFLQIPLNFLNKILAMAKYFYLLDKVDSDSPKLQGYAQLAYSLLNKAITEDQARPDEDASYKTVGRWGGGLAVGDPARGEI